MAGLAGTAVGLVACGGNLDPGAGNDPGTGTRTLAIDGTVHASPRLINASLASDFDTDFTVQVSLNNQTVTTGTLTITSVGGKSPLTYHDGRWSGSAPGYDEVYVLDVMSGPDSIAGVRVDGPDIHVFSTPSQGAPVDTTMPLTIKWHRDAEANTAELRADTFERITIPDTGAYALASGSLKADKSQARLQTLRLLRTNRVAPSGAAAGSTWQVTLENRLDVVAQPQPEL